MQKCRSAEVQRRRGAEAQRRCICRCRCRDAAVVQRCSVGAEEAEVVQMTWCRGAGAEMQVKRCRGAIIIILINLPALLG